MIYQIINYFIIFFIGIYLGKICNLLIENIPKYIYEEITLKEILFNLKFNIKKISNFIPFNNKNKIIIEIITAIVLVFNFYYFDNIILMLSVDIFLLFSITLFFIDLKYYLLPNILNFPLIFIGLIVNINGSFSGSFFNSFVGAISGYLSLYIIYYIYLKIRKIEGMGLGDLKLVSAIGAWIGYQELLYIITIASLLGLCYSIYNKYVKKIENGLIPFGPFLIISAIPLFYLTSTLP